VLKPVTENRVLLQQPIMLMNKAKADNGRYMNSSWIVDRMRFGWRVRM
jgi:hypothetical protein